MTEFGLGILLGVALTVWGSSLGILLAAYLYVVNDHSGE